MRSSRFADNVEHGALTMNLTCPRCRRINLQVARFCSTCGLSLACGPGGREAGRIVHPEPLPPPAGFEALADAEGLHYAWESAWGSAPLIGTEPLRLELFNAGYALKEVMLEVRGVDREGKPALRCMRELEKWDRGQHIVLEIPSYDIAAPLHALDVRLARAEFEWDM